VTEAATFIVVGDLSGLLTVAADAGAVFHQAFTDGSISVDDLEQAYCMLHMISCQL
jgi:hypothetical protein